MTVNDPKRPEHEAIYTRIRDMILFGALLPGEPVTILGLKDRLGAGVTPVREAIRRLSAEGALEPLGNRRICVPDMTPARMDEIYFARLALEPKMAQLAAGNVTEDDLTLLQNLDTAVNAAIALGDATAYLEANYRFHFALYDRAGTPILRKIVTSLWLQLGPSLKVVMGRYGTSNLPDMHASALLALSRGDGNASARAIEDDIRQGLEMIRHSLGA